MQYLFYIILGLLPSFIWLSFYLRKDKHPEPNSMVLKIFIWGILLAPLAIILELLLIWLLDPSVPLSSLFSHISEDNFIKIILINALIPALVEEYLKYSVVRVRILRNSEFDEPVDAMIYCIIAGLGFATIENLLIIFKIYSDFGQLLSTIGLRFLGATLVHALSSGIVGYWLALSLLYTKQRRRLILFGLTVAIIFHACYNYLIIVLLNQTANQTTLFILIVAVLLVTVALLVSSYFRKLKKQQSICKINE